MNTIAIIQARTGSERLPNKVLAGIAGQPMLAHVVERTRRCSELDEVVVATTTQPRDAEIVELAERYGWPCFRGSERDVLDRFYQAASYFSADYIVRITADCPLIDPAWIGAVVQKIRAADGMIDYVSNFAPRRTLPRGLDCEAMTFSALRKIWLCCSEPRLREHVSLALYERPGEFKCQTVQPEVDLEGNDFSDLRWTVDTADDLQLIRSIFTAMGDRPFTWTDVLLEYPRHPEWRSMNAHVEQKKIA